MTNFMFWLLLFSPLVGFLINAFRFKSNRRHLSPWIGIGACLMSFFSGCTGLVSPKEQKVFTLFEWIEWENFNITFSFTLDSLSLLMILLITGVGAIIHIYSAGYMARDPGITRYFAWLNLFVFNMLVLVLADSLPLLFVGWEGVGLCSYLLIGFWFKDSLKVKAGMKAFVVNRLGDGCFLLGIFLLFSYFGTLSFQEINSSPMLQNSSGILNPWTLGALFLFLGATAKSAQIPLYVWLADAMAGPTPVSALIHAATMVTAGVYLVLRLFSLYSVSPDVLLIIGWVGALTAFGSALAAVGQWDLKKILAYSTISQLGYMFMALSVKAFPAGAFHLMTHGFFKALLFLCAGSLIHGLNGQQDIRFMGGLKKYFPKTFWAWIIGAVSLAALPPFSGFFSKDEILWSLFSSGNPTLWFMALVTSALTAFYMTRATVLVFFGKERREISSPVPHESPPIMWWSLAVLSFFSLVLGALGIPHLFSEILPGHPPHIIHNWLEFLNIKTFKGTLSIEAGLMILSTGLSLSVIYFSAYYFLKKKTLTSFLVLEKAFYVDDFLKKTVINPVQNLSSILDKTVDRVVVQGGILFLVKGINFLKEVFSSWQNGNLQKFVFFFIFGVAILLKLIFMG